jgi:hypothetical protein
VTGKSAATPNRNDPSGAASETALAHVRAEVRHVREELEAPPREVIEARRRLHAARRSLGSDLDALTDATQSALDIPAKIRKDPIKSVALAGGAGFLLLGGPRRLIRAAGSRLFPGRKDRYRGLLPDDIERVLRDTGLAGEPRVRQALEADFADYLKNKGVAAGAEPSAARSFWRTYDTLIGPLGTVAARVLIERLFAAGEPRSTGGERPRR